MPKKRDRQFNVLQCLRRRNLLIRMFFGNELTLEISEEDIQNAVEEAQGQFSIPLNSAIVLVKSGSNAPDMMMQQEMQRYYQVSTFSGIPVARRKHAVQPVKSVKQAVSDTIEDYAEDKKYSN